MTKKLSSRRPAGPAEAGAVQTQPEIAPDAPPAERDAELNPADRYVAQLEALGDDAYRSGALAVLVDVMAWYLARVAVSRTDPTVATADITRMFGLHVCNLVQEGHARAEAEKAKAEGASVH